MLLSITHKEIFENMLRLMRVGVYFEKIRKRKWLFSNINNYSTVTRIYALGAHVTRESYENMVRFGVYLIRWCLEKFLKN